MSGLHLEGAVFDADGTLFDTERLGWRAAREVGRELGWPDAERYYPHFVGLNRASSEAKMLELFGPDFPCDYFVRLSSSCTRAILEAEGVPLKEGAREILELLSQKGLPLALATSAGAGITRLKLDRSGLGQYFQVVVTGDMVSRGKPDPEIYLAACRALGTAPARTLAVEDSPSGVLSASRAGMPVAMVPDLIPPTPDLEPLLAVCRADLPSLSKWLAERL